MGEKRKIDAMLIGADRSGSTWYKELCGQHPDIFVCPVSQRGFFSLSKGEFLSRGIVLKRMKVTCSKRGVSFQRLEIVCPLENYRGEKIVLGRRNMKPLHMRLQHGKKIPKLYLSHNKDMKFLLIIRNPIDRTFSGFVTAMNHRIRRSDSTSIFDINADLSIENPWVRKSLIYPLLEPYLSLFPVDRFLIFPMELMLKNPEYWLEKVFAFLGVKEDITFKDIHKLANPGKYSSATFVPLSSESKRYLANLCMEDAKKMGELSGIDLVTLWGLKNY